MKTVTLPAELQDQMDAELIKWLVDTIIGDWEFQNQEQDGTLVFFDSFEDIEVRVMPEDQTVENFAMWMYNVIELRGVTKGKTHLRSEIKNLLNINS